jgi:hypothetical protein
MFTKRSGASKTPAERDGQGIGEDGGRKKRINVGRVVCESVVIINDHVSPRLRTKECINLKLGVGDACSESVIFVPLFV